MKVIHLLRKPLTGTVASNTLDHGCAGLNIEGSRISTTEKLDGGAYAKDPSPRGGGYDLWTSQRKGDSQAMRRGFSEYEQPAGRWPANLILQHLDGCRCDGVKKVSGGTAVRHRGVSNQVAYGGNIGRLPKGTPDLGYVDADGKETVVNWICEPGCPVRALDEQSGVSASTGGRIGNKDGGGIYGGGKGLKGAYEKGDPGFGDVGGASRYFKQVGGSSE